MRLLSVRLIVSLIVGVTLVSLCTSYYQVLVTSSALKKDLQHRAEVLGESLSKNIERDLERDAPRTLQKTVQQFANREHLAGLAVYDPQGHPIAVTTNLEPLMASAPAHRAAGTERGPRFRRVCTHGHRVDSHLRVTAASRDGPHRRACHRSRLRIHPRRESENLARDVSERIGACCADRHDHSSDRALEYRRSDRPNGELDEGFAHGTSHVSHQAAGSGTVPPAGAGGGHHGGKPEHRPLLPRNAKPDCGRPENPSGLPIALRCTCARVWKMAGSLWSRIANPTCTFAAASRSR